MRPYSPPTLKPLGSVAQLTQTKTPSLPGPAGSITGTGALVLGYIPN